MALAPATRGRGPPAGAAPGSAVSPSRSRYRRGVGIMLLDPRRARLRRPAHRHARRLADAARRHRRRRDPARGGAARAQGGDRHRQGRDHRREPRAGCATSCRADLARQGWGGGYRGQEQKWFAMRFTGSDGDIDLATHHPEFDAWKWVAAPSCRALIVPFKRAALRGGAGGIRGPRSSAGQAAAALQPPARGAGGSTRRGRSRRG